MDATVALQRSARACVTAGLIRPPTYKTPHTSPNDMAIFLTRDTWRFQISGIGSKRIVKSKMKWMIPADVQTISCGPHVPGTVGSHNFLTGVHIVKSAMKVAIAQANTPPTIT